MGYGAMVSPNRVQGPPYPLLVRQAPLYSLTFDEAQSQLGNQDKPINAMKLDELVKNVILAEEGQFMQNPSSSSIFLGNVNLSGTVSKKTVEEVWKEIACQGHQQLTLGETTLEEFLVRAGVMGNQSGVIPHQPLMDIDPMVVIPQQHADWLQFHMAAIQHHHQQQQTMMPIQAVVDSNFQVSEAGLDKATMADVGYPDKQLALPMRAVAAVASSDSHMGVEKQCNYFKDEMMEKTIERRQKRMIKNRESAARSRARKQAYTNQLEHKVFQLRRTNNWLNKQKEVEKLLHLEAIHAQRYQLRRTTSSPF